MDQKDGQKVSRRQQWRKGRGWAEHGAGHTQHGKRDTVESQPPRGDLWDATVSVGQGEEKGTGGVKNEENLMNVPQAQGRERGHHENGRQPEELTIGEISRS